MSASKAPTIATNQPPAATLLANSLVPANKASLATVERALTTTSVH